MSETGWPLIPRELLPAPVKRVRHPRPADDHPPGPGRQLSIFGADTTEPSPADLAGLLTGPGRLERMGGTARVTVPVDAGWRVHVLMNELVRRGLVVSWHPLAPRTPVAGVAVAEPAEPTGPADPAAAAGKIVEPADTGRSDPAVGAAESDEPGETGDYGESGAIAQEWRVPPPVFEVRTAYSSRLNALARGWPEAADRLFLSGPRLRLWVAAAGCPAEGGFRLGLSADQDPAVADAALVRAGLAGSVADDRRSYLITGTRRLARLAELIGERPPEAPPEAWPGGVAA